MLSLDAPTVALVWQAGFARLARTPAGWPEACVLGASTWLAYAADRWFEGWRLAPDQIRTQRHHFYQRWRWAILAVWLVLFAADLLIALTRLTSREIAAGLILLGPVLLYLLSHQLLHRDRLWRVPKEVCVALLIAGGAAVFPCAATRVAWPQWIVPLALFALVCFANCALISAWEHEVDAVHGQRSLARQHGRHHPLIRALPWALVLLALACAALGGIEARPTAAAVGTSAALLGLIDLAEAGLGWQLAHALADAALLTPLLFGPWR